MTSWSRSLPSTTSDGDLDTEKMSSKSQRSTRLSSGSVKKRSYIEEADSDSDAAASFPSADENSDSEEDFKPEVKTIKRGSGSKVAKRDSPSSEDFTDDDDDEDDDEGGILEEVGGAIVDSDEEAEEESSIPSRKKFKAESHQEIIEVLKAPKGKTPRGTISPHLIAFLRDLKDPIKNDRDWFAQHKNIYDYVYQNWLEFVEASTDEMMEKVDDTIAWLPPKTLIERIYRDVRFSNDKTPYKKHVSWCLSRNGRKGNFAKYYLSIAAGGSSGLNAGMYEPSKQDLQAIRDNILTNTAHGVALRNLVMDKEFCKQFGAPPKGAAKATKRTSLWGAEDELKKSPKDYSVDHPDIAWLRLKHFTVSHRFTDEEVLSANFMEKMIEVARVAQPLVHIMNEILHGIGPAAPADES